MPLAKHHPHNHASLKWEDRSLLAYRASFDSTHLASLVGYCIVVVGASLVKVPELGVAHELGTCRIHFVIRLSPSGKSVAIQECLGREEDYGGIGLCCRHDGYSTSVPAVQA